MTTKQQIAAALDEIATLLELSGESEFKVRAFSKAARAVREIETDLSELAGAGALEKIPGIGKATSGVIREMVGSGRSEKLESLRAAVPKGVVAMTSIPGIGIRNARILYEHLEIESLDELEAAVADGRVRELPGFGPKAEAKIAEALRSRRSSAGRVLLSRAFVAAGVISERLAGLPGVAGVEVSGQVRRRCEVVDAIVIVVAAGESDSAVSVARRAASSDLGLEIEHRGDVWIAGRTESRTPVEIFFVERARFAITLLVTTGSEPFVAALVDRAGKLGVEIGVAGLARGGREIPIDGEEDIFAALDLPAIPPELREEAAAIDRDPATLDLVSTRDLRGTFHVHSTWSDGRATLREMLVAAKSIGLSWVGISDHSKSATYARGLDETRLGQQRADLGRLRDEVAPMRVFWGIESDILGDGSLDYDEATLAGFDFVIASVHSRFKMPRGEMTERIVRAIRNPFTTIVGHLTGRMLLGREGCHVEYGPIFDAAARHGVIIEINGSPRRLDLDWRRMREAVDRGVTLSIHPDAHDVGEYGNLMSGTWAARKGGLRAVEVFNTRDVDEVAAWLEERKRAALGG